MSSVECAALPTPPHLCFLCKRKFPAANALARHEQLSELHKQNLEKQDVIVQQHKQEMQVGIGALRQQIQQLGEPTDASSQSRRVALETQLRQLLGEFAQAQEMLEHIRVSKSTSYSQARPPTRHDSSVGQLAIEVGAACWQGGKDFQEDRYILNLALTSPEGNGLVGFAVLDGHSGSRCVDHVVERLPLNIQACLSAKPKLTEEHLRRAVMEACALTDSEFLTRARQQELMDGSTLILGIIYLDESAKYKLLICNVGDSRAVLCRASIGPGGTAQGLSAMRLSDDHKPNRPDEQQRIEGMGGCVDIHGVWRVFAPEQMSFAGRVIPRWGLAVSRAFGDQLLKEPERYGCKSVTPGGLVIAEPELNVIELDPALDRFLVLGCDGIWDILPDADAVAVCASQAGAELAAYSLTRHAFAAGSGDNLTALVVAWRNVD